MAGLFNWSSTAGSNTAVDGVNIAEGCPAGNLNNGIRSVMALVRATFSATLEGFLAGTSALGLSSGGTGATTAADARTNLGLGTAATRADSYFLLASTLTAGSNANGYWVKRSDGNGGVLIEQWGTVAPAAGEGAASITFPTAFTSAGSICLTAMAGVSGIGTGHDYWINENVNSPPTTTGATVYVNSSDGTGGSEYFRWRAIGY